MIMTKIVNKIAQRDYEILKTYVAGIVLTGAEVKSIRLGQASLKGSHVKFLKGLPMLVNAQVTPYKYSRQVDEDSKRSRALLLKKREIDQLIGFSQQKGLSIIPLSLLSQRTIKLEIGVGRGRKKYEKRDQIKKRDQKREMEKQLKGRLKGF